MPLPPFASVRSEADPRPNPQCRGCCVDALAIDVEVDISNGLPSFTTVGLPVGAVKEGRERVAAALGNAGYILPLRRITVNLAPADVQKRGSAFDLPIAIGILIASGQIADDRATRTLLLGELGLEGDLRPVRGALPIALAAASMGCHELILPVSNVAEAAVVDGLTVRGATTLIEVCRHLSGDEQLCATRTDTALLMADQPASDVDFGDVRAQQAAKRALEVAAAGAHNVLMIGPPGAGKTMLARRLPSILPPLTLDEALDVTRIHSVAGLLPPGKALVTRRPFRAPHHTISYAGLIGGGSIPRPGEVSLAHHGVLFLDEVAELPPHVLEVLRQPLEDGHVTISRAAMTLGYPARFLFVAAMNPCPCGHAGDPAKPCLCPPLAVQKYLSRISGPLLDRVDMHVAVPPVAYDDLVNRAPAESSEVIRQRVERARERQLRRFPRLRGIYANAHMGPRGLARYVRVDSATDGAESGIERWVCGAGVPRCSAGAHARRLAECKRSGRACTDAIPYRVLDRGGGGDGRAPDPEPDHLPSRYTSIVPFPMVPPCPSPRRCFPDSTRRWPDPPPPRAVPDAHAD